MNTIGRVVAVIVGQPRTVDWHDGPVTTAIWKYPRRRPPRALRRQHRRRRPGRPPGARWTDQSRLRLRRRGLRMVGSCARSRTEPGTFGDNLTITGVDLAGCVVGERWQIGSAVLRVTEPRIPCFARPADGRRRLRHAVRRGRPPRHLPGDRHRRRGRRRRPASSCCTGPTIRSPSASSNVPTTVILSYANDWPTSPTSPKAGVTGPQRRSPGEHRISPARHHPKPKSSRAPPGHPPTIPAVRDDRLELPATVDERTLLTCSSTGTARRWYAPAPGSPTSSCAGTRYLPRTSPCSAWCGTSPGSSGGTSRR